LGSENGGRWRELIDSRYGDWRDMEISMANRKSLNWWKDLGKICDIYRESS